MAEARQLLARVQQVVDADRPDDGADPLAPRYYRRFAGPVHIVSQDARGARTRHNLLMVDAGALRLRERIVVFDFGMIPNSLIYPP